MPFPSLAAMAQLYLSEQARNELNRIAEKYGGTRVELLRSALEERLRMLCWMPGYDPRVIYAQYLFVLRWWNADDGEFGLPLQVIYSARTTGRIVRVELFRIIPF